MTAKTVTIHPLNVKPGDIVVTVTSDTEITVTRDVPEWRQGQTGTGTLNFYGGKGHPGVRMMRFVASDDTAGFVTEDGERFPDGMANHVTDFVPDEVQVLPSDSDLLAAITAEDSLSSDPQTGLRYVNPHAAVQSVLALLRGESR